MRKSRGIRTGPAGKKGRGVFATGIFDPDDLIERAPIILMAPEDPAFSTSTVLNRYWYETDSSGGAIGLGFTSLYNHSYRPNAVYRIDEESETITITAVRRIRPGDEITINYNGDPKNKSAWPFARKRPKDDTPAAVDKHTHFLEPDRKMAESCWVMCGHEDPTWTTDEPALVNCGRCLDAMSRVQRVLKGWRRPGRQPSQKTVLLLLESISNAFATDSEWVGVENIETIRRFIDGMAHDKR